MQKALWYMGLITSCQGFIEELGLDDASAVRLREFVLETAKEKFKEGYRCGKARVRKDSRAGRTCPGVEDLVSRMETLALSLGCSSVIVGALKDGVKAAFTPNE